MKKFIRANHDRPLFCHAPRTIPHARHEVPESDPAWAIYRDKPWDIQARVHASYCSMADRFLGGILALLKEQNLDSNTLVLFSPDNGAAGTYGGSLDSAGNLRGQKTLMYEGGIPRNRHMYWEWNGAHCAKGYGVQNQACRRGEWKIVRNKAGHAKNPKLVAELDAWVRANRIDPPPQAEPSKPEGLQWR
jgi:hypothetical protein